MIVPKIQNTEILEAAVNFTVFEFLSSWQFQYGFTDFKQKWRLMSGLGQD